MAISLVSGQVASNVAASSSLVVTLPNNPTPGNLVVLGVVFGSITFTATAVDSNGNSYVATPASPATHSVGARAYVFYLKNAPDNASKTVTITVTGSSTTSAWIAEFAGANKTAPFDLEATHNNATSQTNINDPTITPSSNNELLFTICAGNISTANSPWTAIQSVLDGNLAAYVIQTTKAAQAINFTQTAGVWLAIETAFSSSGTAVIINATSTTTSTLIKRATKPIAAVATSTSNLLKRVLKVLLANAVTSSFVSALKLVGGSASVIINATVTTTASVSKRITKAINALVTSISFAGRSFSVHLSALVSTVSSVVLGTQKLIFAFGKNILFSLFEDRIVFAVQEDDPFVTTDVSPGSFVVDVSVGAGYYSGAFGTFTLEFDE